MLCFLTFEIISQFISLQEHQCFHFHHQVAAGMKVELTVEIYAIAVGVEGDSGVGRIFHNLQIITETDNLSLPISANILYVSIHNLLV